MKNCLNTGKANIINYIFYILAGFLILVGLYYRINLYMQSYPLCDDEYRLIFNITDKHGILSFFLPLDYGLKIPPLFYGLVYFFTKILIKDGVFNTFVLRFIPMLSGVLSVFGFYILLKQIFKAKLPILLGLLLFAVNIPLIYYSNDFHPYSTEVLVCILLLIYYKYFKLRDVSNKRILIYTLSTFFLVLFSFPTIFIIPSMILAKFIEEKKINYKALWIIFLGIIIPCLYLWLSDLETYRFMNFFWDGTYESSFFGFSLPQNILIIKRYFEFITYDLININIKCLLFIFGFLLFIIEKKKESSLFLFIFLFLIIASFLHIYPFSHRVILFLMPVNIILFAECADNWEYLRKKFDNKFIKAADNLKSLVLSFLIIFLMVAVLYKQNSSMIDIINNKFIYKERFEVEHMCKVFSANYKEQENVYLFFIDITFDIRYYTNKIKKNEPANIVTKYCDENKYIPEVYNDSFNRENLKNGDWIFIRYFDTKDYEKFEKEFIKHKIKYDKYYEGEIYLYHILGEK